MGSALSLDKGRVVSSCGGTDSEDEEPEAVDAPDEKLQALRRGGVVPGDNGRKCKQRQNSATTTKSQSRMENYPRDTAGSDCTATGSISTRFALATCLKPSC